MFVLSSFHIVVLDIVVTIQYWPAWFNEWTNSEVLLNFSSVPVMQPSKAETTAAGAQQRGLNKYSWRYARDFV